MLVEPLKFSIFVFVEVFDAKGFEDCVVDRRCLQQLVLLLRGKDDPYLSSKPAVWCDGVEARSTMVAGKIVVGVVPQFYR